MEKTGWVLNIAGDDSAVETGWWMTSLIKFVSRLWDGKGYRNAYVKINAHAEEDLFGC